MDVLHTTIIAIGMLISDRTQGFVYRIIYADNVHTWICRIDDDSWPIPVLKSYLLEELGTDSGMYKIEFDEKLNRSSIQQYDYDSKLWKRYQIIKPLIDINCYPKILIKGSRAKLISDRLNKLYGGTRQHIVKLLKLFWKRGMTPSALETDYKNCGGKGKKRMPDEISVKTGAPRTISRGKGVNSTAAVQKILQIAADYYLTQKKRSLEKAIDYITDLFYSKHKAESNNLLFNIEVEPDAKPTVRQLRYFIESNTEYSTVIKKREGQKKWDLNYRDLLGKADGDVQGPGDSYQIDASVGDVYLVSQLDRRRVVGRTIIYFVIDTFSRLITGIYVGFEGPSWIGAMMALANMVTPKSEFCRQYGITNVEPSIWPSHHVPRRILADRGELMSCRLGKNITENLHIEIENTSPGRGDLKSIVERNFGIIQAKFRTFVPGYVPQDFKDKKGRDPSLDATLNLAEFTKIIIYSVIKHNYSPIKKYKMSAEMVTDEITPSPIELWNWGIENRSGVLKVLPMEMVALNVMPQEEVSVTPHGIKFSEGYYTCPTAIREEWFARARHKTWKVTVSYDPRDLGVLYLRDPNLPDYYERSTLIGHYQTYEGKTRYEAEEIENANKQNIANKEDYHQEIRIAVNKHEEEIIADAKKRKADAIRISPNKPTTAADIRMNKSEEKKLQRAQETFTLGENAKTVSLESPHNPSVVKSLSSRSQTDDLELLRKSRQNRLEESNER